MKPSIADRKELILLVQGSQFWPLMEVNPKAPQLSSWEERWYLKEKNKPFLPWFVSGAPDQVPLMGTEGLNSPHSTIPFLTLQTLKIEFCCPLLLC